MRQVLGVVGCQIIVAPPWQGDEKQYYCTISFVRKGTFFPKIPSKIFASRTVMNSFAPFVSYPVSLAQFRNFLDVFLFGFKCIKNLCSFEPEMFLTRF